MCCFSIATAPSRLFGLWKSRPTLEVSGTSIFARVDAGVQWLAYSMTLATSSDVAMVLPLPVARASDDALTFVDLSSYPQLFERIDDLFPHIDSLEAGLPKGGWLARRSAPTLVVHRVGSFDASFVPSLADMSRLDRRFRLPDDVWTRHADYASYGFAVFKLRKGDAKKIHPMAMRWDTKEPGSIFFPTVHVHDGQLHEVADFDHRLTYQAASTSVIGPGGVALKAFASMQPASSDLVDNSKGLVVHGMPVHRVELRNEHRNTDVRVPL